MVTPLLRHLLPTQATLVLDGERICQRIAGQRARPRQHFRTVYMVPVAGTVECCATILRMRSVQDRGPLPRVHSTHSTALQQPQHLRMAVLCRRHERGDADEEQLEAQVSAG